MAANDAAPGNAATNDATPSRRAPTEPIAERIWHAHLALGSGTIIFENILGQQNHCIRSRQGKVSVRQATNAQNLMVSAGAEFAFEGAGRFPYPTPFRKMFAMRVVEARADEENHGEGGAQETHHRQTVPRPPMPPEYHPSGLRRRTQMSWSWGFDTRWFGVSRKSVRTTETTIRPVYVVLGVFPRGYGMRPRETVVFAAKPRQLFWRMQWAVFRLRGWSGTFLSLRHVKGFRLYRCDAGNGTHERVNLDSNRLTDLQLLTDAYKRWHVPSYIAEVWAEWIHQELNNTSQDVLEGTYSLELVLDWSVARISTVILLPVLLSLAIGLWLNSKDWTDLATIQTAWGTASYVVTAGGLTAALLGVVSGLADK